MSETKPKTIALPAFIAVRDLAQKIDVSAINIIRKLMENGTMVTINQAIDFDTAAIVASEMGYEAELESQEAPPEKEVGEVPMWRQMIADEEEKTLSPRPPVVTILGHVDHGKTSLLDAIRDTDVAAGEVGGITQHIGAYQVELKGRQITFLDTPGHAAFTSMRARGAQGADIVILVVAADDGVMPQTKEAIAHAKAARVPIIVALNKIDKANANPERVKQQLAENELVPDEWGGNIFVIPVSAKQKLGISDLLETVLLVADNTDIRANSKGSVIGTVIEAELDKSKGPIATLLVQNGTLETGDIVIAGNAHGRLRALFDFRGRKVQKAGPSFPVAVMGLNELPSAGDVFKVVESDKEARQIVGDRAEARVLQLALGGAVSRVPVSSTKSMTGHLLSGAAAVEALACLVAIHDQALPPTINLDDPDPECDLQHVPHQARPAPVRVVASNSFGFGGSNTCLVFRKAA